MLTILEQNALRYVAVRHFKDARDSGFDQHCDETVDSFLKHLEIADPTALKILLKQSKGIQNETASAE